MTGDGMKYSRQIIPLFLTLLLLVSMNAAVPARDDWIRIKSKNFLLVGNASENEIRRVANRLEQFRESFQQAIEFGGVKSAVPTNVVVFKDDSYYTNFKPLRADGKVDNKIA